MTTIDPRLRLPLVCPFDHNDRDSDVPVPAVAIAPQIAGINDPYPLVYLPVCGSHLCDWFPPEDGESDLPALYLDGRRVADAVLTGRAEYSPGE